MINLRIIMNTCRTLSSRHRSGTLRAKRHQKIKQTPLMTCDITLRRTTISWLFTSRVTRKITDTANFHVWNCFENMLMKLMERVCTLCRCARVCVFTIRAWARALVNWLELYRMLGCTRMHWAHSVRWGQLVSALHWFSGRKVYP